MNAVSDSPISNTDALSNIQFSDIFILDDIQRMQDLFSEATGVASIITHPDGTPITRPSNFTRLCQSIIRKTEKGCSNCFKSDAIIGGQNLTGPIVQKCLSGILWDAGVSITVGGKHFANWLIGQVREEEIDELRMIQYADEIGVKREEFRKALSEVPVMSVVKLQKVAEMLFVFAKDISEKAYSNLQLNKKIADRERANELLQQSESLYRAMLNASPDSIAITDLEGHILMVSPIALTVFGYQEEEEITGHLITDYIAPEHRSLALSNIALMFQGTMSGLGEYSGLRADGSHFFMEANAEFIRENDGQPTMMIFIVRDITERKLADEKLRESEEKYRLIFENSPLGLISFDEKGVIHACNNSFTEIIGAPADKLIGLNMLRLPNQKMVSAIQEALSGKPGFFEGAYRSILGNKLSNVRAFFAPMDDGDERIHGGVGIIEDVTDRLHIEDALIRSEENYRNIFENAQEGIFQTYVDGTYRSANPALAKMYGFESPEELIKSRTDISKDAYADSNERNNFLKMMEENGFVSGYEYEVKRKDGSLIWFYEDARAIKDEYGKIQYFEGFVVDITAKKLAEEALQKSEEKYRAIFENVQDVFFQTDLMGTICEVSPSIKHFSDFSRDEVIGIPVSRLYYDPEEREILMNAILKNGELRDYELRLRTRQNEMMYVSLNATLVNDANGNATHIDGALRDITERKLAEEKIRKIGEHYQAIIENAPDGIVLLNEMGDFKYISPAGKKIFGYDVNEDVKGNPAEYTHPDDLPMVLSNLGRLLEDPAYIPTMQYRFMDKMGNWKWIESTMNNLIADPSVESIVINFRDINDRKNTEVELVKAKEKAEESDRLKSAFLANMSHEIRTPMNGILGFADLLKEPDLSGEERYEYISIIERSGARMVNIINDIIDISKIESGQMKIAISETNLNQLLDYIYNFFKPEAEKKGLQILCKKIMPLQNEVVQTDSEKVNAIFINLVKNAIKFTKTGFIEFGYAPVETGHSQSLQQPQYLTFFVKDTGVGVRTDQKEFIFERFRQGNETLNKGFEGAGLGLSISKAFIEMLGGQIWVESEVGQGSTFYFTLPLK